jgi:hypothetical protein
MSSLSTIPGIEQSSLELLEAAGFLNLETLARTGVEDLARELERANEVLHITDDPPTAESLEEWIVSAREMAGVEEDGLAVARVPAAPSEEDMAARLARAPFAIPLPGRYLVAQELGVSDIAPAILLEGVSSIAALEVAVEEQKASLSPQLTSGSAAASSPRVVSRVSARLKLPLPVGADAGGEGGGDPLAERPVEPAAAAGVAAMSPESERLTLLRAPLESTNRGKNPKSRRYVRGVLHSHPISITFGAMVTLAFGVVLPLAIASGILLLLSDQMPDTFEWVPQWVLAFPIALPVMALIYAIWGAGASCRICGQKLFLPKNCIKNVKAHHIPGLGHIVPVCLHILLFRWFRCTHCGTAVRLKK